MGPMKSDEDLDRIFENGEESILDYADMNTLRHPNRGHDVSQEQTATRLKSSEFDKL